MRGSRRLPTAAPRLLPAARPAVIGTRRLSIEDVPERERPLRLQEFFEPLGVRYEADRLGDDPIEIDLTVQGLPGILVLSGPAHAPERRPHRGRRPVAERAGLASRRPIRTRGRARRR
jgi:hypothetical protein